MPRTILASLPLAFSVILLLDLPSSSRLKDSRDTVLNLTDFNLTMVDRSVDQGRIQGGGGGVLGSGPPPPPSLG